MKLNENEVNKQAAELFSNTFGDMDEEQFYYKHFKNPRRLEEPVSYITKSGKICAMNAFDQVDMLVCGQEVKAIQSSDSAVAKECRGQGLFQKIQTDTLEKYSADGGDMLFGILNENSFPIFMKLNWKYVGDLEGYRRIVSLAGCLGSVLGRKKKKEFGMLESYSFGKYAIMEGKSPDIVNEEDIRAMNSETSVGVKRSLDYYRWRIFDRKDIDYVIIKVTKQSRLEALFIVTRKKAAHFVFADIVEWYVGKEIQEEKKLRIPAKVLQKGLKGWCDFSTVRFVNPQNEESYIVRKLGYKQKEPNGYRLITKEISRQVEHKTDDLSRWRFRGLDPDTMLN